MGRLVADVGVPRGKEIPDPGDGDRWNEDARNRGDKRKFVPRGGENLGHSEERNRGWIGRDHIERPREGQGPPRILTLRDSY